MNRAAAIKVEDISKRYYIQSVKPANTLRDALSELGKNKPKNEAFWALKNISFEVKPGEVLGVIGKNGSGKSTLLKILSRITDPTMGRVFLKGRVASLLEVGTGFNPELSGRENILLNGAILGMSRGEILSKFEEIVDFSGVEKFIDTPVKRYSSGMYVRLAFAVAAHLESEILLVDEVLAVGDAEFQKKCLGKMESLSKGGNKTVIFISHNMMSIKRLCSRVLLLEGGEVKGIGSTGEVTLQYEAHKRQNTSRTWAYGTAAGTEKVKLIEIKLESSNKISVKKRSEFYITDTLTVTSIIECKDQVQNFNLSLHLYSSDGVLLMASGSAKTDLSTGFYTYKTVIPPNLLNSGSYYISMMLVMQSRTVGLASECLNFQLDEAEVRGGWYGKWPGYFRPKLDWHLN